jgi:hypothetical protein
MVIERSRNINHSSRQKRRRRYLRPQAIFNFQFSILNYFKFTLEDTVSKSEVIVNGFYCQS